MKKLLFFIPFILSAQTNSLQLCDQQSISHCLTIKASTLIVTDFSWTFPTSDSAGVFKSDGSGNISLIPIGTSANNLVQLNGSGQLPAVSGALLTNLPIGSMVYPAVGIANSTGTAWGTSYTVGTGANNLVELNGSSQLPAVDGSLLTNVPSPSNMMTTNTDQNPINGIKHFTADQEIESSLKFDATGGAMQWMIRSYAEATGYLVFRDYASQLMMSLYSNGTNAILTAPTIYAYPNTTVYPAIAIGGITGQSADIFDVYQVWGGTKYFWLDNNALMYAHVGELKFDNIGTGAQWLVRTNSESSGRLAFRDVGSNLRMYLDSDGTNAELTTPSIYAWPTSGTRSAGIFAGVSGQSVDIFDIELTYGGTKEFWVDIGGVINIASAVIQGNSWFKGAVQIGAPPTDITPLQLVGYTGGSADLIDAYVNETLEFSVSHVGITKTVSLWATSNLEVDGYVTLHSLSNVTPLTITGYTGGSSDLIDIFTQASGLETFYINSNGGTYISNLFPKIISLTSPVTSNVALTVDTPSGQSVDVFDMKINGTKYLYLDSGGWTNVSGLKVGVSGCQGCGIISQSNPSRAIGSIYHNTGNSPIFVTVSVALSATSTAEALTDSASNPTTIVSYASQGFSSTTDQVITFIVLPNNYYKVINTSGTVTLLYWTEWQ